jgi:hypothetical protein
LLFAASPREKGSLRKLKTTKICSCRQFVVRMLLLSHLMDWNRLTSPLLPEPARERS